MSKDKNAAERFAASIDRIMDSAFRQFDLMVESFTIEVEKQPEEPTLKVGQAVMWGRSMYVWQIEKIEGDVVTCHRIGFERDKARIPRAALVKRTVNYVASNVEGL